MKNIFKILSIIFISIFIVSCWKKDQCLDNWWHYNHETKKCETEIISQKIKVLASITPISSIINYIWWEEVEVSTIVPSWVSPHNFDLTAQNLVEIENSNIIFSIWLGHIDWFLDKWVKSNNLKKLSEWINLLEAKEHNHEDEEHHDDHHHNEKDNHENHNIDNHEENEQNHDKDPHIWLGEENLKIISDKITKKLTEIKPEKKEIFEKNKANFDSEIENIFKNFKEENKNKKVNNFIVFHDAYNYLLQSLNIDSSKKEVFSENVSAEIDAASLKELLDEIKEHNIKIIFKEPQFNSKQIEDLAKQNNLKMFTLDPIWTDSSKEWFIKNLKNNLENLKNIY